MTRIVVTLGRDERDALVHLARGELRSPRDQARFLLRQQLERLGLLSADAEQQIQGLPQDGQKAVIGKSALEKSSERILRDD